MRYLTSSTALSRPIWSFWTMEYMLLRANTKVGLVWTGMRPHGRPGGGAHISWAIALRTERRGRRPFWMSSVDTSRMNR